MPPSVVSTPDLTAATIAQTGTQAASAAAQTGAITAQTAQQAANWALALKQKQIQDATFNWQNALQTAEMVLRNTQMIYEWDESRKDRNQWQSRNNATFASRAKEYDRQTRQALTEKGIAGADTALDRKEVALQDKEFDVAGARAYTGRRAEAARQQAEEEAAGIAGTGVEDYGNFLGTIGARAADYEKEAQAFTDPLLAATPGSTVSGSRYVSEFDDMAKAAPYARDNRQAEVDAFAYALGQSRDPLNNIEIGQSGLTAQMDKINRESQLHGFDQALASAGLTNKGVALGLERADIDDRKADARYQDIFGRLGAQRDLDRIAQAHPRTLTGQEAITFPAGQLLGNINKSYKTKNTAKDTSPSAVYPVYGTGTPGPQSLGVGTFNPGYAGGGRSGGF
jgi:hypothetical protein